MVSNTLYDTLSAFAKFILPALGTFYLALAGIWGLPAGEQVVGTVIAVEALLGAVLLFLKSRYKKEYEIVSVPWDVGPTEPDVAAESTAIDKLFEEGTDPEEDYDPKHA